MSTYTDKTRLVCDVFAFLRNISEEDVTIADIYCFAKRVQQAYSYAIQADLAFNGSDGIIRLTATGWQKVILYAQTELNDYS
jgi:hypothetical protein